MPYERRRPEETVLYKVVRDHLAAFLAEARAHDGVGLPRFIESTFRAFLRCGRLEEGFARITCECGHEAVLPFSCKGRGVCSSCMARMMADSAAHLVDHVLPHDVPYRQWVVSWPHDVMRLLAFNPDALVAAERMAQQHILRFVEKRTGAKSGGLASRHRMGGALNVLPHLHVLEVDGGWRLQGGVLSFHPAAPIRREELDALCTKIANGLEKILRKRKLVPDENAEPVQLDALQALTAAAMQRGTREKRGPALSLVDEDEVETPKGKLEASDRGVRLYASPILDGNDREALERTVRYLLRPPFALGRLSLRDDGMVAYRMKKMDRKGNTVLVMSPMELLARLGSLIPIPRRQTHRLFGVFAARSKLRSRVVVKSTRRRPRGKKEDIRELGVQYRQPIPWRDLLKRIFGVDSLRCPKCGRTMQVVAVIEDKDEAARYLAHMGLKEDKLIRGPPIIAA